MLKRKNNQDLSSAMEILSRGGIIGFPTETVYGIACDAANSAAVKKLYHLKNREQKKPLQVMCCLEDAFKLGEFSSQAKKMAEKFWPGPLTLVVKKKNPFPLAAEISFNDTVGIRIPNHHLALEILKELKKPLAATSANISGGPAAKNEKEAEKYLSGSIDLYIKGDCDSGLGSTVVDVTPEEFRILRLGEISEEEIRNLV